MRAILAVSAAALVLAAGALALPTAAHADVENDGLRFEASTTFQLQPAEEHVRVSMDISVTNEIPNDGFSYSYFDTIIVPALAEAENVVATSGSSLSTSFDEGEQGWGALAVYLPNQLTYGETHNVSVEYDLPNQPPRSEGWTSATAAYASFPLFAVGDPGLADVRVEVPKSYEVNISGAQMHEATDDGLQVYYDDDIDPLNWWGGIAAQNPDKLKTKTVTVDDIEVELRYWPGDKKWANFASKQLKSGLPALAEVVGEPYPAQDTLTITESGTPHVYGLAGFYDSEEHSIEVSDELDEATFLHELAHAWFNYDTSSDTWLIEGLTEVVSHKALEISNGNAPEPEKLSRDGDGAMPLVAWRGINGEPTKEDDYGYSASWWVLDKLANEVGDEKFTAVVGGAVGKSMPYAGDEPASISEGTLDWRRMLDLFEEVGESKSAEEMFTKWVLEDKYMRELNVRETARETYAELEDDGGGWAPPLEVRRAMSLWQFANVDDLAADASKVLDDREVVLDGLASFGVDELPGFEAEYESATSIDDLAGVSEQYVDVAATMDEADDNPGIVLTALSAVGLIGYDLDGTLDESAKALADGDIGEAQRLVDDAEEHIDGAPLQTGIRLGGVALVGLLLFFARRFHLRRREADNTAEVDAWDDAAGAQPMDHAGVQAESAAAPDSWHSPVATPGGHAQRDTDQAQAQWGADRVQPQPGGYGRHRGARADESQLDLRQFPRRRRHLQQPRAPQAPTSPDSEESPELPRHRTSDERRDEQR